MSYKKNLIELDRMVAQSDIADEYRCAWYGDIPVFTLFKDDKAFLKGELHEVVESLEKMIPPTIDEMAAALQFIVAPKESVYRSDSFEVATNLLNRYKSTKPTEDEVSFFD